MTDGRIGRGGGLALPPYPFRRSGPCVVAGNAWTLMADLERARAAVGDVPVIAVNGAAKSVKALALFSFHPERFETGYRWAELQRMAWGGGFEIHAAKRVEGCPTVDYWWEDARGGGGSAWGARKAAWLMGFDPVILCGTPLEVGNYADGSIAKLMHDDRNLAAYRDWIAADTDWHEGCIGTGGWTGRFFGSL